VAVAHGFEFGKLLVAPVVAAALNQLARRGEVCPRLLGKFPALLGARRRGLWRTVVDELIERGECRDARYFTPLPWIIKPLR
jgi:hypothetical protein